MDDGEIMKTYYRLRHNNEIVYTIPSEYFHNVFQVYMKTYGKWTLHYGVKYSQLKDRLDSGEWTKLTDEEAFAELL